MDHYKCLILSKETICFIFYDDIDSIKQELDLLHYKHQSWCFIHYVPIENNTEIVLFESIRSVPCFLFYHKHNLINDYTYYGKNTYDIQNLFIFIRNKYYTSPDSDSDATISTETSSPVLSYQNSETNSFQEK